MSAALAAATVLLVTDDVGLAATVRRALLDSYDGQVEVVAVDTIRDGAVAHAWRAFDVAILDADTGRVEGVREVTAFDQPPAVFVLADVASERDALSTIRAGAEDVLPKGRITADTLGRVVRYAVQRRQMRTATVHEIERLREERETIERVTFEAVNDLKQPLTTVRGMAGALEMKLRDRLDDEDRRILARLQAGVGRVSLIVDDLLERASGPAATGVREPVDLRDLVLEVLDLFHDQLQSRGFAVTVDDLPRVWASRPLVQRVVENVLGAAITAAADEPAPRLRVTSEHDGEQLVVSVEDNGPGIPVGRREDVFALEPQDPELPGLAASRTAVGRLGGRIWIDGSTLGGTAVRFTMPSRAREALATASSAGGPSSR